MPQAPAAKKLLILGAGVGGLSVIKEIAAYDSAAAILDEIDITIVDEDFSHFLGFTLPWVMRGWRAADSVPIRPTEAALNRINRVTGRVSTIDPQRRQATLADDTTLDFDALILATGARNAVDRVPGLADAVIKGVAIHYYDHDAAAVAHRALSGFTGGRLMFLVTSPVYRCPVAPYEGAMLAADLLETTGTRASTEITAYTPEAQPMPSAGPYAGLELIEFLRQRDIAFHAEHQVVAIDAERRVATFDNGAEAGFDLLMFIPPHRPAVTIGDEDWISVDTATMATRHPGIYAIGDTTAVTTPWGRSLPKAAAFARNGAVSAARSALHYLGIIGRTEELSGQGYCYLDTGAGASSLGAGDFFAEPPEIHLSTPSAELNRQKNDEEQQWRALWETENPLLR
ncbi:NAD(P)/FAD-dependent oxidoreductase [[Mycobacterium] holstebronense]|uniref:FAD/NAD(P)-binding oxidoreductase n=1 Tax=[Mycobacterium] holstebronense TaxID=3064288 RepID=A0ABN9NA69_9MYCO|nr:FAD/NAD(P)-binding oxidoreductase [Mycolicibacter sp. MU0102]CAJ1503002.1 FAD/NAD(P)-binding oxidoreductase [Mycolicibacter sp. MU0102]